MLRWPYGKKTEPIDSFAFEEFTTHAGVRSMLWGNGAFLAGLLLGETFVKQGMKSMKLGSIMTVGDMPYYYYTDADGDQTALPCTDRLLSEPLAAHVASQGFMPLAALKGRAEVRLTSFQSLAGKPLLGPWSAEHVAPSTGLGIASTSSTARAVSGEAQPVATPEPAAPVAETASAAPAEAAASVDAELDALLASLNAPSEPAPAAADRGTEAIDPELAALLADL
jgi:type VI secretion system protein ImpC